VRGCFGFLWVSLLFFFFCGFVLVGVGFIGVVRDPFLFFFLRSHGRACTDLRILSEPSGGFTSLPGMPSPRVNDLPNAPPPPARPLPVQILFDSAPFAVYLSFDITVPPHPLRKLFRLDLLDEGCRPPL